MEQHPPESEYTNTSLPPGTVVLEARGNALSTNSEIILHPRPTNDPNDPLVRRDPMCLAMANLVRTGRKCEKGSTLA